VPVPHRLHSYTHTHTEHTRSARTRHKLAEHTNTHAHTHAHTHTARDVSVCNTPRRHNAPASRHRERAEGRARRVRCARRLSLGVPRTGLSHVPRSPSAHRKGRRLLVTHATARRPVARIDRHCLRATATDRVCRSFILQAREGATCRRACCTDCTRRRRAR
jgi:hypothetical protein